MVRKPNQQCIMQELEKKCINCMGWCDYCNKRAKMLPEYKLMMKKRSSENTEIPQLEEIYKRKWVANCLAGHKRRGFTFLFTKEQLYKKVKPVKRCAVCRKHLDWSQRTPLTENDPTLHVKTKMGEVFLKNTIVLCRSCNSQLGKPK